jgi:putative lysine transport system permease protein
MIVQAVILYYLLPSLLSKYLNVSIDEISKILTITVSGIIIVSLNTTAYLTEVLRGGIEAVDDGQLEAARSLGMPYSKAMVYVVLPQAIKNSLPAICNEFIINIKDTSVLNVIGVAELFFVANEAQFKYYRTYEPFIIVALIYLFLTLTTSKILGLIEKKLNLSAQPLPSSN